MECMCISVCIRQRSEGGWGGGEYWAAQLQANDAEG
jgi:hypothetical protein